MEVAAKAAARVVAEAVVRGATAVERTGLLRKAERPSPPGRL